MWPKAGPISSGGTNETPRRHLFSGLSLIPFLTLRDTLSSLTVALFIWLDEGICFRLTISERLTMIALQTSFKLIGIRICRTEEITKVSKMTKRFNRDKLMTIACGFEDDLGAADS